MSKSTFNYTYTENNLISNVVKFLKSAGYKTRLEVSSLGQSIDIVCSRGRWVTAIEGKMKDWRRALDQCKSHQIIADYIVIAWGGDTISKTFFETSKFLGYGIIHCSFENQEGEWALKPKLNENVWKPQRTVWMKSAGKVPYEY